MLAPSPPASPPASPHAASALRSLLSSTTTLPMAIKADESRDKKPRIRHSEAQLAALNELYEENEHPSLEERAALADTLGMEAKAVNAWFANKRSATKKKTRGAAHPYSSPASLPHFDNDDDDDENRSLDRSRLSTPLSSMDYQMFPSMDSDNRHVFDSEISMGIPRRMRIRPTPKQTEELRRLYNLNTHPTREEREALGDRIGMKYQSVTNWFQNQRSLARKRMEEHDFEAQSVHSADHTDDNIHPEVQSYNSFPPATAHPSLGGSGLARSVATRSVSDSFVPTQDPKIAALRRSGNGPLSRPRRTRPEPYQLEALKKLFTRTPNPSIEERGALALEIGMDIGKVTNWFRNLRQTARKRAQKANNDEGDDDGMDFDDSAPASRLGTPYFTSTISSYSSSASADGDVERMDLDGVIDDTEMHQPPHSDGGSEEEDQEAVTPPPSVARATGRRRMDVDFLTGSNDDLHLSTPSKQYGNSSTAAGLAPPRVEDAMLLLSFSRHLSH